jgi:transposase
MTKPPAIDYDKASELLANGATIRDVANSFGVSTQSVYLAIKRGRIVTTDEQEDS